MDGLPEILAEIDIRFLIRRVDLGHDALADEEEHGIEGLLVEVRVGLGEDGADGVDEAREEVVRCSNGFGFGFGFGSWEMIGIQLKDLRGGGGGGETGGV